MHHFTTITATMRLCGPSEVEAQILKFGIQDFLTNAVFSSDFFTKLDKLPQRATDVYSGGRRKLALAPKTLYLF